MNKIVTYLESKEVIFHSALALIVLYVPHAGHLFMRLEHLDMTFFGVYVFQRGLWQSLCAGEFLSQCTLLRLLVPGYTGSSHLERQTAFSSVSCTRWLSDQLTNLFFKRLTADKDKV